jgi:hypothetical protein
MDLQQEEQDLEGQGREKRDDQPDDRTTSQESMGEMMRDLLKAVATAGIFGIMMFWFFVAASFVMSLE